MEKFQILAICNKSVKNFNSKFFFNFIVNAFFFYFSTKMFLRKLDFITF